jgi:ATP-dependent helicase/nuclease subunit A
MSDAITANLDLAARRQREATRPGRSAWVEANAGTGKTKVLTDRVARLLLVGAPPQRILCLTFTKAAAAEMRNRLAINLGRWAMASDAELDQEFTKLVDRPPEFEERLVARRLFARVLDAPGGINILTIHAFCQALLKRFPLEAGVPPGFDVLDEGEAVTLLKQAENEQMEALARSDEPTALSDALAAVANKVSAGEYGELMQRLLAERAWLLARIGDEAGLRRTREELAGALGCEPDDSAGAILSAGCADRAFDGDSLRAAMTALGKGGKQARQRAALLARWLENEAGRPAMIDAYLGIFFTEKGEPRANVADAATKRAMSDAESVLRREADRIRAVVDCANGATLVDGTLALLRLGLDICRRYSAAKRRRGALDYDDLIVATRQLLESAASAAWVLYKLDGGIDHVLVDEAQDTNPDQWEVIRKLTDEFFVVGNEDPRIRTVFAVGDAKQSIFGFQRADPRKLAEMLDWYAQRARDKYRDERERYLSNVELDVSFRSTAAVLDAVDWVFSQPQASQGVSEHGIRHRPSRIGEPGLVELWPIVAGETSAADPTDIEAATRQPESQRAPHDKLAHLIARHAKGLIDGKKRRAKTGEPLNAGHFMVLVRRRNALVTALVKELKQAGIDVAGVDRLNLGEQLAIQDLLALARFVLLPHDDLNLACLLKSPLLGIDESGLFELAHGRKGHLWRALRERAGDLRFAHAHRKLAAWLAKADFATPFDFFSEALGPEGGRRHLIERLGHEAADPIDELLARALQYQRTEPASLQGFLRWFEAGGGEIKRDLDQNRRREVRILTVHAAKGLQAPIVYLPDTTRKPANFERLLVAEQGGTRLWVPRARDANQAARDWRKAVQAREMEEQNRLLYVAMTRAEDRLYVGGWVGARKPDRDCWYHLVEAGLKASIVSPLPDGVSRLRAVEKSFDFASEGWSGDGYELVGPGEIAEPRQAELALPTEVPLPAWIAISAPAEPEPPTPLAPSQPLPDELANQPRALSPLAPDDGLRWKRGLLLHELLQHLPALPAAERAAAARRFLGQPGHGLAAADVEAWAAEALAVTEASEHAALFAPGSRAEVSLIGTVATPRGSFTVSGQIDRLAVNATEILIVDYKTNRPPPERAADVPLAYRRQLALYRALLGRLYPGRRIRAFLLWTAALRLMELDGKTLDESMPFSGPP